MRRLLGICPQHDILYEELSAIEHLQLYGALKGVHKTASDLEALVAAVKLTKVCHKRAGSYSGGMKRRLSCAVAFVGEPQVVMLDEPTTGMDPMHRNFVWDYLRLAKASRVLLLTTHSMEEADALGDRIGIMSKGQLAALGSPVHLKRRFGNGYRMQLVVPEGSCAVIRDKVGALLPAAKLVDESAGNLIYTVQLGVDSAQGVSMAAATELFAYVEEVQRGEHPGIGLTDWGVSHTTLEDVFLKLAKADEGEEAKPKAKKKKGVIDDRNIDGAIATLRSFGSGNGGGTGGSPALGANREGDMGVGAPRNMGTHQVKALMHKTFNIQRRQRCQFFWCFLFVPIVYASLMPVLQYLLVTRTVELTMRRIAFHDDFLPRVTCSNATEAMRMACKERRSDPHKYCYQGPRAKGFTDHNCEDDFLEDRLRTSVLGVMANGKRVHVPSEKDEHTWDWLDGDRANPKFSQSCDESFWYDTDRSVAANLAGGALFKNGGGYNNETRPLPLPDFCECEGAAFDALVAGMASCQEADRFQRLVNTSRSPEIQDGHTYALPRELRAEAEGGRHVHRPWDNQHPREGPRDGGPSVWAAEWLAGWRIMVAATANGKPLDEDAAEAAIGRFGTAANETAFVGRNATDVQLDASGLLANMPHAVVTMNQGRDPNYWDPTEIVECQAVEAEHTCCIEVKLRATYAPGDCWEVATRQDSSDCAVVKCSRERSLDKHLYCKPCDDPRLDSLEIVEWANMPRVPGCGYDWYSWEESDSGPYDDMCVISDGEERCGFNVTYNAQPATLTRYCSTAKCRRSARRCVQDSITGNWSSPGPTSGEEGSGSGSSEEGSGSGDVTLRCAAAKCPANPLFVAPVYARGNSMGDITESMLRYSEVFLDGRTADGSFYIEDVPHIDGPFPRRVPRRDEEWPGPELEWWDFANSANGSSYEAERFVPSAAIEFADVDASKLRGTFKLASSWGSWYEVFQALEHSEWYTQDRWSWRKQFPGVEWKLIKPSFSFNLAAVFQNWVANALLRSGLGDAFSITTRMHHLPKSERAWWLDLVSEMEDVSNLSNLYFLAFGTISMLPVSPPLPTHTHLHARSCTHAHAHARASHMHMHMHMHMDMDMDMDMGMGMDMGMHMCMHMCTT